MITVLAVAGRERAEALDAAAVAMPSLELLHATGLEDTLDRLARNRRIDAVLLLVPPADAREIAAVVLEEDPGAPPMFCAPTADTPPGVRPLEGGSADELLASLSRELAI